jgi:hypothetical protein
MYRGFPGEPEGYVQPADEGWTTVGPSAVAYPGAPVPHALTIEEIGGVVQAFVDAARRSDRAGSTSLRFTPPMAICCTSSSRRCRICAPTGTGVISPGGPGCCSRWSTRSARRGRRVSRCLRRISDGLRRGRRGRGAVGPAWLVPCRTWRGPGRRVERRTATRLDRGGSRLPSALRPQRAGWAESRPPRWGCWLGRVRLRRSCAAATRRGLRRPGGAAGAVLAAASRAQVGHEMARSGLPADIHTRGAWDYAPALD